MPEFGTYISIDELGYPKATIRDCVQLASTLNRTAALNILGLYNLALAVAAVKGAGSRDREETRSAQRVLLQNGISSSRLDELKRNLGNADLFKRPLFHRGQILVAIKLVAKFGEAEGGNRLEQRSDFDVLGELALRINSLFGYIPDGSDPAKALACVLAPSIELENPADIAASLVRACHMLHPHLETMRIHYPFARQVERLFVFSAGLNFQELIDLTFAVWTYYSSLSVQALVNDQRSAHFNPSAPGAVIGPLSARAVLDTQSVGFWDIAGLDFGSADSPSFLYDHTALRAKPIWRFDLDNYMCFDPAFLQEKLAAGVYWTVMNALDADEREEFARLWGRLFEMYVLEQLRSICDADRVIRSPKYANGDEAFDFLMDCGAHLIAIQAKSTFAPIAAKYAADEQTFFDGLEPRFGTMPGAAIRQLHDGILRCFELHVRRPPVREIEERRFREVLPVVVHQEPIFQLGLVSRPLLQWFEQSIDDVVLRPGMRVRAPIFVHVDDLHSVSQYIRDGDTNLVDVLHGKLAEDRTHFHSFSSYWSDSGRQRISRRSKGDTVLTRRWREYAVTALRRFRGGTYK